RDAEIAFNYFEDYMMVLEDGGATYVNGGNCNPEDARLINSIHDNYAVCHEKRSRARYGYYMDGAASNWDCYHNVVINANHPIFAQPHPQSTSHHVHCHDIYSNTPYGEGMFYTERDNLVWDYHDKAKTEEELFAMYPAAVEIKKNAGVKQA
ncbi:MAG: hypothetical protein IJX59_07315, partial [Clostridia bacterium]|nr:hypothetical protein [Clostridia bacterium]